MDYKDWCNLRKAHTHTQLIQKKVETTDPIFNMASRFFQETFCPWSEVQCLTCPLIRFQSETQLMCCWVEDGSFILRRILCQNFLDEFSKLDDTLKNNFRKPGMLQMGQGMGMFHHIGSTFRFLNSMAMVYSQKRNVDSNWSGSFKIIWMLVRRRGSGKCLQEQLVWRVRLMQFLCLNSLDRKDQGFRKMHKNTRMEFEETRTHTHTSIRCSWFTSLEPLYQFFVPYQTMWLWLVFPSSYFGVRVCVLIISSCQVTSTNFNNQVWQPTSTTNFDNQTSKLLYLRSVCLSMTRWTKSTLTPALLVPENPPRMTSRSRGMKVDGSIQRRFSTRSNGKSRGLRVEAVDPSWWGTTELWIFLRITSPKVSQSFWMDLGIWNDRLCIYYMYIC